MGLRLIVLAAGLHSANGLRKADPESQLRRLQDPQTPRLRLVNTSELVPHCLVDSQSFDLQGGAEAQELDQCLRICEGNPECIGVQYDAAQPKPCALRRLPNPEPNATCASHYRSVARSRGFEDIPMVPLGEGDGTIYMREDCVDSSTRLHGNTYWGVPWDWEQPGVSLLKAEGYGVSPLLDLVTPSVLDDLIRAPLPNGGRFPLDAGADIGCADDRSLVVRQRIIDILSSPGEEADGRALIVDIGQCICSILGSGWNPSRDLQRDVVLLLHKDENFGPAPPLTRTSRLAALSTTISCVRRSGKKSEYLNDQDAFLALADNPRLRAMYFFQAPPITHNKIFVVPMGVDITHYVSALRARLSLGSLTRNASRTALYEVSHNLATDYRRRVFNIVQANFGEEPLRQRHIPWAAGDRMGGVAEESLQTVFGQSPIGIGANCYRHGELLLAGAIPVVQSSLGIAALRYLPHLAVSNWHEVTPHMLRSSYRAIWDRVRRGDFTFEPLTSGFWVRHIQDTAYGRPISEFYAKFKNPRVRCRSWDCA